MNLEYCALCGCVVHRNGGYAEPSLRGRSHASEHHYIAERFFGRSKNRPGEVRDTIFQECPWGGLEHQKAVFCYECHEELLHNPVFLPRDIAALAEIVRARELNEGEKSDGREKLAGRIKLLHEIISEGLRNMLGSNHVTIARQLLDIIRFHLAQHPEHVASILTGPAREDWFNSEAYVAVNAAQSNHLAGSVLFYGEEEYRTVLSKVGLIKADEDNEDKRPDLVGYITPSTDVGVVIEAKVVYSPVGCNTRGQITKLREQIDRAKGIFPDALVLGIVYAAHRLAGSGAEEIDLSNDDWEVSDRDFHHQPKLAEPQIQPSSFFSKLSVLIREVLPADGYAEVDKHIIIAIPQIQSISGKAGPLSEPISLGVGGLVCL